MCPLWTFLRFHGLLLTGRIRFPRRDHAKVFRDGAEAFRVFRMMRVSVADPGRHACVFLARFRPRGMSPALNRWFSLLPIPVFGGAPGLLQKWWLVNDADGSFLGYYRWKDRASAEGYRDSFAGAFMRRRSRGGSVSFRLYGADEAPAPPA